MPDPILLSTWHFGAPANAAGFPHLTKHHGILDALEQTCIHAELDPAVDSVGIGGLPDSSGTVSLDGAIMLSPARSAGVAYLRKYPHPVSIARRVMEKTPHKLLVGEGAELFAAQQGFKPATLLTETAVKKWRQWKTTGQPHNPHPDFHVGERPATIDPDKTHDTLGVLGIDASGNIGVACTTSGRAFKLPGRVGDSPLIGPGLYCDPTAAAAVATGTGELMIGVSACFLVVERIRAGDRPIDAIRHTLTRVADSYQLAPKDQCALIALTPEGHYATGALRKGFQVAITAATTSTLVPPDVVLIDQAN
jgi:L-asparaginase/N4-(beta-N-acetylglucosaminyl)-L-asparaginase